MAISQILSTFALEPLLESAVKLASGIPSDGAGKAVAQVLAGHFSDQSKLVMRALERAHDGAWRALEVALTGESFWERIEVGVARADEKAFRQQVRLFLESIPPEQLLVSHEAFREQCLRQLRSARRAGMLAFQHVSPEQLARNVAIFARFSDPQQLLGAERKMADRMSEELRIAGMEELARLVAPPEGLSLLVVMVRYFLRRQVEQDPHLFQGLAFAQLEQLHKGQQQGLAAIQDLVTAHGARLEAMLDEVQQTVRQTHTAVLDVRQELQEQGQQNQDIYQAVLDLRKRFDMMQSEVRPRDSLSIRNEEERRMVKEVVARYRSLPEQRRQKLPALLNAIGQLELAAGSYQAAEKDFAAVAGLVEDEQAEAEAHANTYRAALEARDWDAALRALLLAVRRHPVRYAPFPLDRFEPQKILGAGGFGVAFLCRHRFMHRQVVVKTLLGEELGQQIDQLFAEAQVIQQLDHPGIVRIQDCGFTDPARHSRPYLVMEYFEGVTLQDHVKVQGPLPLPELLLVAGQIAQALQAAHQKQILHRDVKPANVLVRRDRGKLQAQLIDFGLALRQESLCDTKRRSHTLAGVEVTGTLEYAPPEQLGRLPATAVGPYSDVYGFAKTCCFALFQTTQPVLRHWQSIPENLANLLGHCLAENPAERPADFGKVLRCLDELEAQGAGGKARARQARQQSDGKGKDSTVQPMEVSREVLPLADEEERPGRRLPTGQVSRRRETRVEEDEDRRPRPRPPQGARRRRGGDLAREEQDTAPNRMGLPEKLTAGYEWIVEFTVSIGLPERFAVGILGLMVAVPLLMCLGIFSRPFFSSSTGDPTTQFSAASTANAPRETVNLPPARPFTKGPTTPRRQPGTVTKAEKALSFGGLSGRLAHLAFSPDCTRLVAASEEGTVQLFATETGAEVGQWQTGVVGHRPAFDPEGTRLAVAAPEGKVHLINTQTGKPLATLTGFGEAAVLVRFDSDGRWLVAGGASGRAAAWPVSQKEAKPVQLPGDAGGALHRGPVTAIVADPMGRYLATAGGSVVKLWRVGDWTTPAPGVLDAGWGVSAVAFSPGGKRLAVGGSRGLKAWDLERGGEPVANEKDLPGIVRIEYGGTRHHLVGLGNGTAMLFKPNAPAEGAAALGGQTGRLTTFAFNPSGRYLATAGTDREVHTRDLFWGIGITERLTGHSAAVLAIAYSPDGAELASGDATGNVILWRVPNQGWDLPHDNW